MEEKNMKEVEEMTMDELHDEVIERIIASKTTIREEVENAIKNGGTKDNQEFSQAADRDAQNNRRIHALRAELMKRGVDWIDIYPEPAKGEGSQSDA